MEHTLWRRSWQITCSTVLALFVFGGICLWHHLVTSIDTIKAASAGLYCGPKSSQSTNWICLLNSSIGWNSSSKYEILTLHPAEHKYSQRKLYILSATRRCHGWLSSCFRQKITGMLYTPPACSRASKRLRLGMCEGILNDVNAGFLSMADALQCMTRMVQLMSIHLKYSSSSSSSSSEEPNAENLESEWQCQ